MVARSFDEIRNETVDELRQLSAEARIVYRELVLPNWGSKDRHGFPRTLYGHLMNAFSFVDLLSIYQPSPESSQARRMRRFMVDHLAISDLASRLSAQLWRNTLMHTAAPRPVHDLGSGNEVIWLLHWADHLPRDQHMTVIDGHHSGQ